MPTVTQVVPNQQIDSINVGYIPTGLTNVIFFLYVDNVAYSNGIEITYSDTSSKTIFAGYDSSTGLVKLYCRSFNYNSTNPAASGYVEIYVAY